MASRLKKLQDRAAAINAELREITQRADTEQRSSLTEEETAEFSALETEGKDVDAEIQRELRLLEREKALRTVADPNVDTDSEKRARNGEAAKPEVGIIPVRHATLRNFKGQGAEERAYKSGMWLRATIFRDPKAAQRCRELGLELRAQSEGTNTAGGYLVPDVLEQTIIDLREVYGVFRRECRVMPMGSETVSMPRRTGGLTAYFVNENTAITESSKTWDSVALVAKKLAAIVLYPTELAEDAIISLADDLAGEIAYAFSLKEDQCGFIGDGTSTYGGIHGATVKVNDGNHAGSIHTSATGNTAFETLDLADFHGVVGKLPLYARPNAKWYISAAGFANSMERLMYAAGGNTTGNIMGGTGLSFMGYPVVLSQVLNSTLTAQTSTIVALFGDLRLGAAMGDRRGITIKTSDQRYFELDQIAIQGTERFDINVHDLGDASNAGPIVALKTASS